MNRMIVLLVAILLISTGCSTRYADPETVKAVAVTCAAQGMIVRVEMLPSVLKIYCETAPVPKS